MLASGLKEGGMRKDPVDPYGRVMNTICFLLVLVFLGVGALIAHNYL